MVNNFCFLHYRSHSPKTAKLNSDQCEHPAAQTVVPNNIFPIIQEFIASRTLLDSISLRKMLVFPDVLSCVCTTCLRVKLKINAFPLDPLRERKKGRLSRLNKNTKAQSFVPVEQRRLNKDF